MDLKEERVCSEKMNFMKIQEIDSGLLNALHDRARVSERLRIHFGWKQ